MFEFYFLGNPRLNIPNRSQVPHLTDREIALIAYIAIQQTPQSRSQISQLFWGGRALKQAKSNLRTFLARHKNQLEPYLDINRDRISLKSSNAWIDILEFEARLQTALRHKSREAKPIEQTAERFKKAIHLCRGAFLEGVNLNAESGIVDWIDQERDRIDQQIYQAKLYLINQRVYSGQYEEGVGLCHELLEKDRFDETVQGYFIRCLAQLESIHSAQTYFEQYTDHIYQHLGVKPSDELIHLVANVVRPTRRTNERLSAKTDLQDQPFARPLDTPPPRPLRPLIGRQKEIQQIKKLLAQPSRRLVTIIGIGGIGKTHLALHIADELAHEFIDGVLFSPLLVESTDHHALESLIAGQLNLPLNGRRKTGEQLIGYLRERDMLIIIDNAESEPLETSRFAQLLLEQAPNIKLLVTSRTPLNIRAESLFPLEGLPVPHTLTIDAPLMQANLTDQSLACVQLFVSCANQAFPKFELTPSNLPDIIQICRLVGGLPLAVELAAAWVGHYSCAEIVAAIQKDIHFLHSRFQDHPDRHNDIIRIFNHSWQLLSTDEKSVLLQLSSFTSTFSREAVQAIVKESVETLISLVEKSMLHISHSGRYEMHDLVRRFVSEKWGEIYGSNAESILQATQYRFGDYYLGQIMALASELHVENPHPIIKTIQTELANIQQAWYLMITLGHFKSISQAINSLSRFYHFAGLYHEAQVLYENTNGILKRILSKAGNENRPILRGTIARVQAKTSFYCLRLHQFDQAHSLAEAAIRQAKTSGDVTAHIEGLLNLGEAMELKNQIADAEQNYVNALTYARKNQSQRLEAVALRLLGRLAWRRERLDEADRFSWQALAIEKKRGDLLASTQLIVALALNAEYRGNLFLAESYYEEAIENYLKLSNSHRLNEVRLHLGRTRFLRGQHQDAQGLFEEVLNLAQYIGEWRSEGESWCSLVELSLAENRLDDALLFAEKSLRLARLHEDRHYLALSLAATGEAYQGKGLSTKAGSLLQESLEICDALGIKKYVSRLLIGLSLCAIDYSDLNLSLQYAQDAFNASKGLIAQAKALAHLGYVRLLREEYQQANDILQKSLALIRQIGYPHLEQIVVARLAHAYHKKENCPKQTQIDSNDID